MQKTVIREKWTPPEWALQERLLFDTLSQAAVDFVQRYTRADGTLIWRDQWPGMDGSDDPYEGFMNLALLYVLGGSEEAHQLSRKVWDAITWQWTQYGQIHDEFDAYYDWMHHGEGYLYIYFLGLANPHVLKDRQRALNFAAMYTGENPQAPNYDPQKRLIRSPINGSKGPRFDMNEEDWCTHRGIMDGYLPPFEDLSGVDFAQNRCPWSDDQVYKEIIAKMNQRMAKGDVPLNLNATSLITNAYLYTGDESYRQWVLDYVDAWAARTAENGGIIPDNVGLSGKIGEYNDGKWWGGYYGWRWPHGFMTIIEPLTNAAMNAVLVSGDMSYLDLARQQLDRNWEYGKRRDGTWVVPYKHFDSGWHDFRRPHPFYPIYLWTVSMEDQDLNRILRTEYDELLNEVYIPGVSGRDTTGRETKHYIANTAAWFHYIQGKNPDYPKQILEANYRLVQKQLERMNSPEGDPSRWNLKEYNDDDFSFIHIWQEMCPVYFEGLLQMTLGAPMHISHGGLQHGRVRYFDAKNKRPGLPQQVAALVEQLAADFVTLRLVNIGLNDFQEVIIQGGTFGEHHFEEAILYSEQDQEIGRTRVDGKWFLVCLDPGAGVKITLKMKRYAHPPTYETPWEVEENTYTYLRGRQNG